MVLTYRHQAQSVGWNWTVKQSLLIGNKDKFENQMTGFLNIMRDADSYGVRYEIRVSAWGANRVMKSEPRDILDRLLAAGAIVCLTVPVHSLTNPHSQFGIQGLLPYGNHRHLQVNLTPGLVCNHQQAKPAGSRHTQISRSCSPHLSSGLLAEKSDKTSGQNGHEYANG